MVSQLVFGSYPLVVSTVVGIIVGFVLGWITCRLSQKPKRKESSRDEKVNSAANPSVNTDPFRPLYAISYHAYVSPSFNPFTKKKGYSKALQALGDLQLSQNKFSKGIKIAHLENVKSKRTKTKTWEAFSNKENTEISSPVLDDVLCFRCKAEGHIALRCSAPKVPCFHKNKARSFWKQRAL